ncbi:DUF4097 family beta strand repeat-containing protein [Solibacillus sp. CAU 1738]|uniref:DUF4097 family beta strand repeat-containing protein n=1 Tax=Solibacillus sp. CAU 1738 TaxID=3140363 RepID=UPI003260B62B
MNKYYVSLFLVGILFLSACGSNEEDTKNTVLKEVKNIYIDHGSTTVEVESADIELVEASWLNNNGPGIIFDEEKEQINIRLESDFRNIINIGKMPQLSVRIPTNYEGKVTIEGSSGNVKIKNLNTQNLYIKGKSGNVSLDYLEINNDINVSIKSGNVLLALEDKDSNVNWVLQSGSGKQYVAIPLEDSKQSNRRTQGKTGDGSFTVQLQTTSGNITVK